VQLLDSPNCFNDLESESITQVKALAEVASFYSFGCVGSSGLCINLGLGEFSVTFGRAYCIYCLIRGFVVLEELS